MSLPLRDPRRPHAVRFRTRPLVVAALTLALGAAGTVAAGPAAAASTWPGKPSGIRVSNAGTSWFTVSARKSAHARSYTLYASTYKPDLYYAHLVHGRKSKARHSVTRRHPTLTISGLRYSTAPIYYRLVARNGRHKASWSAGINQAGLRPVAPWSLAAHSSATGTYVTWSSMPATGFSVVVATNPAMTANRHNFVIHDTSHEFTPYGLSRGTRYYFALRAWNGPTPSHFTGVVSTVVQSREQSVRVMTYNLLHLMFDYTRERGGVIAPWSQRRFAAASLIKSVNPDIIGVQEANGWVNSAQTYRQVDSLRSALAAVGENYTVAHTEALVTEPAYRANGWVRTGNYILYKPSVYRPIAAGGYWTLTGKKWGVYQALQNVSSGARILVVNTHLTQPGGRANDLLRQTQTRSIVSRASSMAAGLGVPVVYLGDYNSNTNPKQYTLDGPGSVMRSTHIADARLTAQHEYNQQYDTMNNYMRYPFHYALDIDYVWTTPGVSAYSWGVAMDMSHGRLVGTIPSDHNPVWSTLDFAY